MITVSYRQLNRHSNRMAHLLRTRGVKAGTRVGVMLERSFEMIAGILAILKAGGVYVPMDPEYPKQRIKGMLEGSDTSLLLTKTAILKKNSLAPLAAGEEKETDEEKADRGYIPLMLDRLERELEKQSPENPEPISGPDDLIYIIFTSGSTGKPKGAGVYHRGFANLMHWFITDFELGKSDCNLLLTSLSFDLTQKNLYASLVTGGMLCIPGINYFEPRSLLHEIREHKVSWINCTPGMFYELVEYEGIEPEKHLELLRYVFLGGEPIAMTALIEWLESPGCNTVIVNTYGPTECTDICCSYRIMEPRFHLDVPIPVGAPVYNVKLFIVDNSMQLQPVGIAGELLIAGAGVGVGYINDRELTERKFIRHSFSAGQPEELLYRTGDLVKWLSGGKVEFLGRIDHQVKIRGFRIELGEIENRLGSHPKVKDTVVMGRDRESGEKYLCAYIVLHDNEILQQSDLRDYLSRELPHYMVPAYFVFLKKMPLNANGKTDRKALPEPDVTSGMGQDYTPASDTVEARLVEIWSAVLGLPADGIGIHDNFFQLGGHSLKVTGLVGRIHKVMKVRVPFDQVFKSPTIRGLAQIIKELSTSFNEPVEAVEKREYYPLSSRQERLYTAYQLNPETLAYNM
ncbi:MAG: non-ribosomal peptide synthetase, partial [bacterium]|nr:non-ribosomal peptide synthetase [bacterium]